MFVPLERSDVGGTARRFGRARGARAGASSWLNLAARAEPGADGIVGGGQPPSRLRRTSPCGGRKKTLTSPDGQRRRGPHVCPSGAKRRWGGLVAHHRTPHGDIPRNHEVVHRLLTTSGAGG